MHRLIEVMLVSVETGEHRIHHREGNPDVGRLTYLGAEELGRSHAYDVKNGCSQLNLSVEHGRIAGEGTFPPRVADDCDGMIALGVVILLGKRSAVCRLLRAADRCDVREDGVFLLHLSIEGIRIQGGRTVTVGYTVVVSFAEKNQLRWIFYRKRTKHDRIEKAEDRCVRTDAESQREQRHGGESGTAKHRTEAIANILKEIFQPVPPPCRVALFFDRGWIAESAICGL